MTLDSDDLGRGGVPVSKRGSITTRSAARAPGRMETPPPPDRARLEPKNSADIRTLRSSRTSERARGVGRAGLDVDAVDEELRRQADHSQREPTPGDSPRRKRQRVNGDR